MLSLTAKLCCRRFPPRISMLMTVTLGRVNFGATSEQPHRARLNAKIFSRRGTMPEMVPTFSIQALAFTGLGAAAAASAAAPPGAPQAPAGPAAPPAAAALQAVMCLPTGDGYLRAKIAGAVDARLDWPNSGTRCEGESRDEPPGVRLSFQRAAGARPNLLLVFGLTGVK